MNGSIAGSFFLLRWKAYILDAHAASLWGVEANYPGSDNAYLAEVAEKLLPEALDAGRAAARRCLRVVCGPV